MKIFRKSMCLLLAVIMVLGLAITASAEATTETLSVTASKTNPTVGEEFSIYLNASGDIGNIGAFQMDLYYDQDLFEYVGAETAFTPNHNTNETTGAKYIRLTTLDLTISTVLPKGQFCELKFNHIETDITDPIQGDKVKMTIYRDGADFGGSYKTAHTVRTNCPDVYCTLANNVTTGDVTQWTKVGTADEDGTLVVDTSTLAPGEYIFSIPGQYGNEYPDAIVGAPGGIRLTIHEKPIVKGDIDGDGVIDSTDVMALFNAINSGDDLDAAVADVNGDGVVDTFDVMALYEIIKSND